MKRLFLCLGSIFTLSFSLFSLSGCSKSVNYTDYVSEYRSEIYLAESEGYALSAFFSDREYPYAHDGVCAKKESLVEIYLTVPDNTKEYTISFTSTDGTECGGDMSYDSVHARWFYSQSLKAISENSITFTLTFEKENLTLQANSVKTGNEMTMPEVLEKLTEQKQEFFAALSDKNSFLGELCVRLVYNEKCYYFVGVTTAEKKMNCFLVDAYTGEILAERTHG